MSFDELTAILPVDCFSYTFVLSFFEQSLNKKHLLPDLTFLAADKNFARLLAGWNTHGIKFILEVDKPFESAALPNYASGDAFELLIDTRDLKTAGFLTRFCHQFVFLPQPVEGVQAQEITRFRTDDRHEHCLPSDLKVTTDLRRNSYQMEIFIPSHCLHGYDPMTIKKLGLTYIVHRYGGASQHFLLSSKYMSIAQHPSLWPSAKLYPDK